MCHRKRRYTSELSDEAWALLRELLPLKQAGAGRPIRIDMRQAVNAMLYVLKTGCQWANLPREFPPYQSVYYHFRKWCLSGLWERINRALVLLARRAAGRFSYPSAGIIDSQSVKTTEVGGVRGYDGGKKVKGRKRTILVDTQGFLWKVVVHVADLHDQDGAKLLLKDAPRTLRLRLLKLWADRAYQGLLAWCWEKYQIALEIVSPPRAQKGFVVLAKRWIVERTLAWLNTFRRLSKDYEESPASSEAMIYLASSFLLLKRLTN